MKTSNFSIARPADVQRGRVSPRRAAAGLPTVSDGVAEFDDISEFEFPGANISEPKPGVARILLGGGGASLGIRQGLPVLMLNNASRDLSPGEVVIVDGSADEAVTLTSIGSNTAIVGVVQEPILVAERGPVLFNGYAAEVVTTAAVARGDYAVTSTTEGAALATASRGPGTFGVFLTAPTFYPEQMPSEVTLEPGAVVSLAVDMSADFVAGRVLFLGLWFDETVSSLSVSGWTRIGSEDGFYYFTRLASGNDTATATWTGASRVVAAVVQLDDRVDINDIVESHDYDATSAAASVSGLSAQPRYAIAAVASLAAPAGWDVLAQGEIAGATTPSIRQVAVGAVNMTTATFGTPVLASSLIVAVLASHGDSDPTMLAGSGYTHVGGLTCVGRDHGGVNDAKWGRIYAKVAAGGEQAIGREATSSNISISVVEIVGAGLDDVIAISIDREPATDPASINIGNLSSNAFGAAVMMTICSRDSDQAGFDFNYAAGAGWTAQVDSSTTNAGYYVGTALPAGGSLDATVTITESVANQDIEDVGGIAVLFGVQGSLEGTIVGRYIGRAASVTSPFSV